MAAKQEARIYGYNSAPFRKPYIKACRMPAKEIRKNCSRVLKIPSAIMGFRKEADENA